MCAHAHAHTHTHTCTYVSTFTYLHTQMQTHQHQHIHTRSDQLIALHVTMTWIYQTSIASPCLISRAAISCFFVRVSLITWAHTTSPKLSEPRRRRSSSLIAICISISISLYIYIYIGIAIILHVITFLFCQCRAAHSGSLSAPGGGLAALLLSNCLLRDPVRRRSSCLFCVAVARSLARPEPGRLRGRNLSSYFSIYRCL